MISIILVSSVFYKPDIALADSSLLFSDGFESDDFGSWTFADTEWRTIKKASNAQSGEYRAEIKGNTLGDSVLLAEESTSGYESVKLIFWHKISQKLEDDDHVFVEWSGDGNNWNQIADFSSISAGNWSKSEYYLSENANDNAGFRFRFLANLNGGSDVFWLDDVELTGNPIKAFGSISGLKFNDINNNGIRDDSEPSLAGWVVELLTGLNNDFIASRQTDASGSYAFDNLASGSYIAKEVSQSGWFQTLPASPSYYLFSLFSGESVVDKNFGNFFPPKIAGYKWHDLNRDGIWQKTGSAEPPLADWVIALGKVYFSSTASPSLSELIPIEIIALSLTGSDGSFSFPVVSSGNYKIFEEKKSSWLSTNPTLRPDSFFDVGYRVDIASKQFDLNSFFDVPVELIGQTEITANASSNSLIFGNIQYTEFSTVKIASLNGNLASASAAMFIGNSTFSVPASGGISKVIVFDGTVASRSDNSRFDISQLTLGNADASSFSGFGPETVVESALQWGLPGITLEFSPAITLSVFLGAAFNGQTFNVVRSISPDGGWTSDGIGPPASCQAADGFCSFTATKASYYAINHTISLVGVSEDGGGTSAGGGGGSIFTLVSTPVPLTERLQPAPSVFSSPSVLAFPSPSPTPQSSYLPVQTSLPAGSGRFFISSESSEKAQKEIPKQNFYFGAIGRFFSGINLLIPVVGLAVLAFFLRLNKKSSKESSF